MMNNDINSVVIQSALASDVSGMFFKTDAISGKSYGLNHFPKNF